MRFGGCLAVGAQWENTGGSSQRCPGFDSQRLSVFFLFSSKFLYFQREARSSEQNPHFCIKCGYKCAVQICNHCLACSTLSLDLLFFWLKHEDCSGFVRDLTVKINAQNTKNGSVDQSHGKTIQPG